MPEEIRFFIRTAVFGLVLAAIYWLVSYEWTGTVLLFAFGAAGAFLALMLAAASRGARRPATRRVWRWLGLDADDGPPIGIPPTRYPKATATPLICGFGLAVAALALVYGPVFLVAAFPPLIVGALRWRDEAAREWDEVARSDAGGPR